VNPPPAVGPRPQQELTRGFARESKLREPRAGLWNVLLDLGRTPSRRRASSHCRLSRNMGARMQWSIAQEATRVLAGDRRQIIGERSVHAQATWMRSSVRSGLRLLMPCVGPEGTLAR
jgi:hypothetical protein